MENTSEMYKIDKDRIELSNQLDLLPNRTGIYKFFDQEGTLLYIGKALNLRSRVNSYFRDTHADRPHIISMIPRIFKIEYIEADSEVEALVLESALIKQNQPPYNVDQRDDKSYAYIYVSTQDRFPTVKVVRTVKNEQYKKGKLFGPYPSGRAVKQVFRYIRKMYPFCTCIKPKEPCLYFHMGQCPGPYFGYVTEKEYRNNIGEILKFLDGRKKRHLSQIEREMKMYAMNQQFEQAAILRDQISDLKHLGNRISASYGVSEEQYVERRSNLIKTELKQIAEQLGVKSLKRIECYDISNIQGTNAYGSMVVAIDGQPETSQYRAFKIREKDTPDDYEMHRETMRRRIAHINNDPNDTSLNSKPDLILIDGGKGQLNAIKDIVPDNILVMGISKGRSRKKKGLRMMDQFWVFREGIYIDKSQKLDPTGNLADTSEGNQSLRPVLDTESLIVEMRFKNSRILSNLRDESHRFALKHHRKARGFYKKRSILDSVKGIGPKKKKELIKTFGSTLEMKKASVDQLDQIIKNRKVSEILYSKLMEISKDVSNLN